MPKKTLKILHYDDGSRHGVVDPAVPSSIHGSSSL